ncbi:MAG TPA: imidazolonepropionase [Flavobacteriales bacterium]|nr:imidazolonepropionase [Flavobacteriales bacterium]HIO67755.1 imidazolonepropionase [Flavobacteriales bacterium]
MKILIKNIKELVQVDDGTRIKVAGKDMAQLPTLKDAWLSVEDGKISDYGSMSDWNGVEDWTGLEVIDATDKLVLPSWCDSHTHLIFAGSREAEFVDRIKGLSYEEIAARGGGILNSAKKLQDTSEEELIEQTQVRLDEIASMGTGAVEIKSGYGLSTDAELKILRVAKKLKESSDLTIKSTFLGAHAIPAEYKDNRDGYLDLIVEEMLPIIKEEGLAEYIDVFCETNYFTVAEMERVMEAGTAHGLKPKVHVNQFTSIGGIEAAVRHKALSVDHLEIMEDKDIEAIVGSETMPTMLPSCSFFLSIPFGPARSLIERGLPVALATDYNPGSTPSGNIPFVLSLACIKMRMTPEEAINAVTLNSAYAMDLSETHGSIAKGKVANLFITKEVPSYAYIPYSFGSNLVDTVILKGEIKSTNGKV